MKTIHLTRGMVTIVDDRDFYELSVFKWRALTGDNPTKRWYAARGVNSVLMHREITRAKHGEYVDHIDGNSLNNQTSNLRICNCSQNTANAKLSLSNTSGFKGVSFDKKLKKWRADIRCEGRTHFLGSSAEPEVAAKLYDNGAILYFGLFALTNKQLGLV